MTRERDTTEREPHTYRIVELVGSSREGVEPAIENAVRRAAQTIQRLDWFEVREIRGQIENGQIQWYQVKLGLGCRIESDEDVH